MSPELPLLSPIAAFAVTIACIAIGVILAEIITRRKPRYIKTAGYTYIFNYLVCYRINGSKEIHQAIGSGSKWYTHPVGTPIDENSDLAIWLGKQ